MVKILVSHSGGMDSTALLHQAVARYGKDHVMSIGFEYPSKHNRYELEAAQKACEHYGVKRQIIPTGTLMDSFKSDLLKSGGAIPEGHYTDKSMSATVVPCRNLIFASVLAGLAESFGAEMISLGIHAGDHAIYPDCRPQFFEALARTINYATDFKVAAIAPFLTMNKTQIIANTPDCPWHLTRTCYKDQEAACGKCGSCVERLEA